LSANLRAFCTDYRKFTSPDEPVFINRIYNILEARLTDDYLREQLRKSREGWRKAQRGAMSFTINDQRITPEHVMDLFINGWVFHMDSAKRQEFLRLWPNPLSRFQLQNLIADACAQLFYMRNLIRFALREGAITQ